ncbi:MAG: hypothetical protein HQL52_05565 [Magnetococcales bacterium]|nr:hypothetical protein [Magnetococcales bacterium]
MAKEDYLLITKIPNISSRDALRDKEIVIIGGAHGTGTEAIELLLDDNDVCMIYM